MKSDWIWCLKSENLTNLGGPMGSETTTTNWRKYFKNPDRAKKYAEKDYAKNKLFFRKLNWTRYRSGWVSEDLGLVMYYILRVKVEK